MGAALSSPNSGIDVQHLIEHAKLIVADIVIEATQQAYKNTLNQDVDISDMRAAIVKTLTRPSVASHGDFTLPLFTFSKRLGGKPDAIANTIYTGALATLQHEHIDRVELKGAYINFFMSTASVASVVPLILNGQYLAPLPSENKTKVMIEYSQPNTHKAFHVGHMRNAALGDCLVRLYEQTGHEVIATNYYGDEGAHVAKCLWWLRKYMHSNHTFKLESDVTEANRGEWLGQKYTESVKHLDLATYTKYPHPGVITARVLAIEAHPAAAATAPAHWRVVTLAIDTATATTAATTVTVVCGGRHNYSVNDVIAYMPVGQSIKSVAVVAKDMMGVISSGVIMSSRELGIEEEATAAPATTAEVVEADIVGLTVSDAASGVVAAAAGGKAAKASKGSAKPAAAAAAAVVVVHDAIALFPTDTEIGITLVAHGRLPTTDPEATATTTTTTTTEVDLTALVATRLAESKQVLQALERNDTELCALWRLTGDWSLTEFRRIYKWLNVRFDHEFFESEVSVESVALVKQLYAAGAIGESNGALGVDLKQHKLGYCLLLKSNGSGLYATKDLALAKRKFELFGVQQSIYVVDAAQTMHFKQVFKVLETVMQFKQAALCYHLPYGQVVLPEGRMKSRSGQVILFSQLKRELGEQIFADFLQAHTPEAAAAAAAAETADAAAAVAGTSTFTRRAADVWSASEIATAQQLISVATIKYGMLNHDTAKDIVFVMSEWTARSGNTGPYMLYAYARIQSICRNVQQQLDAAAATATAAAAAVVPNFTLLTHASERAVLLALHNFWFAVESACSNNNPSSLCTYVYDLSTEFTVFYGHCSVSNAATEELKVTRLAFVRAIGMTIKKALLLLGIETLERM